MQKISVRHLLLKLIATSAKLDFERAPQYNLYVFDTIYNSNSHALVLTSIDRVTSALGNESNGKKRKKGNTKARRTWHTAICQAARERSPDRWSPKRLSARCTRWRSTETLATSLATRTFAKLRPEREKEEEREENDLSSLACSRAQRMCSLSFAHSYFSWFSPIPPPWRLVLWEVRGESERSPWMISRGLGPNGRVYVTVAIE